QRVVGRDGKRYGPLPRPSGKFRGLYHHGEQVVLSYTAGATAVLEKPGLIARDGSPPIFTRMLQLGPRDKELTCIIAAVNQPAGFLPHGSGCDWTIIDNHLCLKIPAGEKPLRLLVWTTSELGGQTMAAIEATVKDAKVDRNLTELTQGGPPRWPQKLTTSVTLGKSEGPFAVDVLTHPE